MDLWNCGAGKPESREDGTGTGTGNGNGKQERGTGTGTGFRVIGSFNWITLYRLFQLDSSL